MSVYNKSSNFFKRDKFKFSVVRFTPRFSNQLDNVGYCTLASQVIGLLGMLYYRWCPNFILILFILMKSFKLLAIYFLL